MSELEVCAPVFPESVSSAVLVRWHVGVGDAVQVDQLLAEIETEKVVLDVPAPQPGRIAELLVETGAALQSGMPIAKISAAPARVQTGAPASAAGAQECAVARGEKRVPMSRLRARIAQRMLASQAESATLTTVNEVDMQPLQSLLSERGAAAAWMPYFVKACVWALRKYPVLNASVDGETIVYHEYQDIGIAVASPRGLVVPVLRGAGEKGLASIAALLDDFGARAHTSALTLDELTGGTFTVSNSGTYGTLFATPIINPPQSAILGVHATVERPVAIDGLSVVRPMKYLSLSYDHRIIDGREAALFLQEIKMLIERPWLLDEGHEVPEGAIAPAPRPTMCTTEGSPRMPTPGRALAAEPIEEMLTRELAALLNLSVDRVGQQTAFSDMGLTSVSAVVLSERLSRALGISLAATMVYAHPTPAALSRFLAREVAHRGLPPSASRNATQVLEIRRPPCTDNQTAAPDKVAVIGMSGRYASARSLEAYWELLSTGGDGVREVPRSRWDNHRYHDPQPFTEGKTVSRRLGWLDDVECFDPLFFGISPAEAELMDPQQRLFLQEAYRAIEDAGIAPSSLSERRCGVYLGLSNYDYALLLRTTPGAIADRLGNSGAIAAARIAYHLNLKGPAITLDTACSSSLVALHLACQALLRGETDLALVGAASLFLSPELYICWSNAGMLAADGCCKTFDDRANGFVAGEGVGAVLLKRLSQAERDGDRILGVIAGSGLNQDGRTNGITAPSMPRQAELVRSVYSDCDIRASSIGYIEAHGTGTHLGDPIELQALTQAFRGEAIEPGSCVIGSAKSSIGHTSAAAGMAGLHKLLLCLGHGELLPQLHFEQPNRHFDFAASPLRVSTQRTPWPRRNGLRRGAVSAFGVSGTNAHVVVDEAPERAVARPARSPAELLYVLSARTGERLQAQAARLAEHLRRFPALDLRDVAHTLRVGRDAMEHRAAFRATGFDDLLHKLDGIAAGDLPQGVHLGRCSTARAVPPVRPDHELAAAWVRGDASLDGLDEGGLRIGLPTYPFATERYWADGIGGPIAFPDDAGAAQAEAPVDAQMSQLIDQLLAGELDVDAAARQVQAGISLAGASAA